MKRLPHRQNRARHACFSLTAGCTNNVSTSRVSLREASKGGESRVSGPSTAVVPSTAVGPGRAVLSCMYMYVYRCIDDTYLRKYVFKLYVYICIYMYELYIFELYVYICMCTYTYVYVYMYIHTCICIYMYICIYRYIYVYKYVYIRMCLHVYTCVCVCAHARACVSVCAGRQVLSCTYVYLCTYTYISHVYVSVYLCVSECVCVHRNHGTQRTSKVYTSTSPLLMQMYTYGKRLLPCLFVRVHLLLIYTSEYMSNI